MFWRVGWAVRQFTDWGAYREHGTLLKSPAQFYRAVIRKLIPNASPGVIDLTLKDGHAIPVRDFMTLFIYKEIFVDRCYDVSIDHARPVIVDIGANTGLFALRMKQLYPESSICCYEPYPPNFEQLATTILKNRLTSAVPIQKAVGRTNGIAKLYIHEQNVGGHSLFAQQASSSEFVEVEVVGLGTVLSEHDGPVDLLKADCEGAEFDILMAMTPAMAQRIHRAIIEPMPKLYDVDRLCSHMDSLGYSRKWQAGTFHFTKTGVR
jgi:FkbM family methyltransferase